jgi:hypothetical protein
MKRILTAVFIALVAFTSAWAQGTAQISGSVRDTTGAVLPGVERGSHRHADGNWRCPNGGDE